MTDRAGPPFGEARRIRTTVIVLSLCLVAALLGYVRFRTWAADIVTVRTLSEAQSPDGLWTAGTEETVTQGILVTVVTVTVYLKPVYNPSSKVELLTVDTGGYAWDVPRLRWLSSNALGVSIAHPESVTPHVYEYRGVQVELRVDPPRTEEH